MLHAIGGIPLHSNNAIYLNKASRELPSSNKALRAPSLWAFHGLRTEACNCKTCGGYVGALLSGYLRPELACSF